MKISTKGRYGLRIMTDIAMHELDGAVCAKEAALRLELSEKYLEQILNLLVKAGLIKSTRGAKGGYHLAREPKSITVEDILVATEGSLAPVACAENSSCCENYSDCPTSFIWSKIYNATVEVVQNITLEDLIKKSSGCTPCC